MKNILKIQNFEKRQILGEGTYGKCYLVTSKIDHQTYVLKQIEVGGMNPHQIDQTMKQAKILQALDHPNIIKCIEAYIDNNTLNIFMDYADAGDLSMKIKSVKGCYFSENQILNWFTQICLAIKHVHDRKIIHRDLKSQNIFLTSQNIVKLGDFGIAKPLQMTLEKIKTVVGTPYYMSPQICQNKQYSLKTDIWSLGVILFQMCALKPPFDANSLPALALKISRGQYGTIPSHYSKDLKKVISDLLQVDPSKRPNINQILKSPLIKSRIDTFLSQGIKERQFSHTILHSHNIFQRDDPKKDINKIGNQQPQLNSIISPRSGSHNAYFPTQTPQSKGKDSSKIKDGGSNLKQKNPFEKRKKGEMRKREISQPSLTPKNNEKKMKSNVSLTNLDKKKPEKEKNNFFKKKKISEDYQTELSEIKQFRDCVVEMHEHLNSDRMKELQKKQSNPKMINNFIKEESQESSQQEQMDSCSEQSQTEEVLKQVTLSKRVNNLSQTLQSMIIEMIGQKQLSKTYWLIEENHGFVLNQSNEYGDQNRLQSRGLKSEGLISLLYGLNNFVIS